MGATAIPPADVRYNRSNTLEQGRLRLALFRAWGGRCAWCRAPLVDASYVDADDVRARVRAMRTATGLDAATTTVLGATLTSQNRRVLTQWGDLLVQRVHAVDPDLSTRYQSVRYLYLDRVEVSPEPECMEPDPTYQAAVVELDAAGRDAYTVARIVCGTDLDDIITEALTTVVTEIDARIADVGVTNDETDGGFSLTSRRMLSANSITAQTSADGLLTVTGEGSLLSSHTAAISWVSDSGERLDDQSDVEVDGTFTFSARTQISPVDFEIEVDHTGVTVQRQ